MTSSNSGHDTTAAVHVPSAAIAPPSCPLLQKHRPFAAKWILKTGETRSLTRKATLGIVEDVSDLVDFVTHSLKQQTQNALTANEWID